MLDDISYIMNPIVSIIVPCYNVEAFIDECLTSLTNQTLREIEIICIDDASTDNTLTRLNDWSKKDSRIVVIHQEKNQRQGSARNRGIKAARGEYIGFVDSDDFVTTDMYETLVNASEIFSADMVVSNEYVCHGEKDTVVRNFPDKVLATGDTESFKKYAVIYGCRMWTNIIRRSIIIDNELFYPEGIIYEDNANGPGIFLCSKTIKVVASKPMYYYRVSNFSTTRQKGNLNFFDRLKAAELFYYSTKRLGMYDRYKDEIEYAFFRLYYQNTVIVAKDIFSPLPAERMHDIPKGYKRITSINIKKNKYYKVNRPSGLVYALTKWPKAAPVLIPLYNIIDGAINRLRRIKRSL